jgi:hypothetical protein
MKQQEKKDKIFVYYNRREYEYREICEEDFENEEIFIKYFGYMDDHLDNNDELTIYELVPHKVLKKDVKYKFI